MASCQSVPCRAKKQHSCLDLSCQPCQLHVLCRASRALPHLPCQPCRACRALFDVLCQLCRACCAWLDVLCSHLCSGCRFVICWSVNLNRASRARPMHRAPHDQCHAMLESCPGRASRAVLCFLVRSCRDCYMVNITVRASAVPCHKMATLLVSFGSSLPGQALFGLAWPDMALSGLTWPCLA